VADVRQSRRQRGVGDKGLDLAEMGDADRALRRSFVESATSITLRVRDDGLAACTSR
jgi:hypothetical protein